MKVNLTKKHIEGLEKALVVLKANAKTAKGKNKTEAHETALLVEDILVRHDNRQEKDY